MRRRNWYQLDNAAKFYSLKQDKKVPAVFRYSVTLTKNVDSNILQKALDGALLQFPDFNCHLKKGVFWYYLESCDTHISVCRENTSICSKLYRDEDDVLIRVSYYNKRINLEVSHILSDGRGTLTFFKCLVYKYLILKEGLDDILVEADSSLAEQCEDSFDKYYTKEKLQISSEKNIYQYKGRRKKETTYMEYHISTKSCLALAKKYGVSLTTLLISVLICAYHERMKELERNKVIKIDVPVDLRQFFKSSTSRNFFGLTSVSYKFSKSEYDFLDVLKSIDKQLKRNVTVEQLKIRMNQMIALEKNLLTRMVPIFIKDIGIKLFYLFSSASCTCCLSNVGVIKVDERLEEYIENFNVLTTTDSLKITVCSYKDDLSIGFASRYVSNDIIKSFCRFFSDNGISGVMNINMEDDYEEM